MLDPQDEGHAAAGIVADDGGLLNAELVEEREDHAGLGVQGTVETVAPVGVAVAKEVGRQHPAVGLQQRDHVVIEV